MAGGEAAAGGMSPHGGHPRWTLAAVVIGSGVVFLDATVVNVALETIGRDLPASMLGRLEGLTYVWSGYLTVLAALLVLAGALGDTYGRRRVFAVGLVGFGVTSVVCGLAPTLELLVIARLLQGAAGALLVPGALAIITATWDGEERGHEIGTWAAATSAVTIVGPFLGGLLVQTVSWRAAFLVNVPLILLGAYALRFVAESRDEHATGRFDWLGCRRDRHRRRRARLRRHARAAGALDRPRGLRGDRRGGRRPRRLPVPDGAAAEPARPARDLPLARVQRRSTCPRSSSTARCT